MEDREWWKVITINYEKNNDTYDAAFQVSTLSSKLWNEISGDPKRIANNADGVQGEVCLQTACTLLCITLFRMMMHVEMCMLKSNIVRMIHSCYNHSIVVRTPVISVQDVASGISEIKTVKSDANHTVHGSDYHIITACCSLPRLSTSLYRLSSIPLLLCPFRKIPRTVDVLFESRCTECSGRSGAVCVRACVACRCLPCSGRQSAAVPRRLHEAARPVARRVGRHLRPDAVRRRRRARPARRSRRQVPLSEGDARSLLPPLGRAACLSAAARLRSVATAGRRHGRLPPRRLLPKRLLAGRRAGQWWRHMGPPR